MNTQNQPSETSYDNGLISLIYAPRPQNNTLALFGRNERLLDALTRAFIPPQSPATNPEEMRKLGRAAAKLLAWHARNYQETSFTIASTITLPSDISASEVEQVPFRTFPFINHLDLLASPEEGLFFDPDDYVER